MVVCGYIQRLVHRARTYVGTSTGTGTRTKTGMSHSHGTGTVIGRCTGAGAGKVNGPERGRQSQ